MMRAPPATRDETSTAGRAVHHAPLDDLLRDHVNQTVFVLVAIAVGVAYSVLLPYSFTQRVSWHNWHYLDSRYVMFSVAFGVATGWIVAVQTYAMRRVIEQ